MIRRLTIIFLSMISIIASAQTSDEGATYVGQLLEEMAADGKLTEDFEEDAAELIALTEDKIDLNKATIDQLRKLIFLSEEQIETLLTHRDRLGPYVSDVELITLPHFKQKDVDRLLHFARVVPTNATVTRYKRAKLNVIARAQRTFPEMKGFKAKNDTTPSPYLGTPYRSLLRISGSIGEDWKGGIVAESDAGEPMFSHGITATDFLSGYAAYAPRNKFIRKAIIGHYSARYGQGLGMWTGFSADMSSVQSSIMKNGTGVSGNLSASESGYLRGAAIALGTTEWRLDAYGSHTDNDASLVTLNDTIDEQTYATTIQTDGYHRTKSELAGRNNFQQMIFGGYAQRTMMRLNIGLGYNYWHGSMPIGNKGEIYKMFYPSGKTLSTAHADYRYRISNVLLYGEIAYQTSGAIAGMQGIDVNLNGGSLTIAYRNFSREYYTIYQNPFSKSSNPGGESGLYVGMAFSPISHLEVLTNVNVYSNRWLQYQKPAPTHGYKARATFNYSIDRKNSLSLKIRHDDYEDSDLDNRSIIEETKRTGIKVTWTSTPIGIVRFKTTVEDVRFRQDNRKSNGYWISEDVTLKRLDDKASIALQVAHFDTDDYYSRIYATQPDVLYSMTMPSYSGRGIAAIGNGHLDLTDFLDMWLWGSYVRYYDRESIGSSYNTIDSRHKIDVKLQFRLKLNYRKAKTTI